MTIDHAVLSAAETAIFQEFDIPDEARRELAAEMWDIAKDHAVNNRDRMRAATVLAGLVRINQTDRLASTYAIPAGMDGTSRILSPSEVAQMMDASVPAVEVIAEPETVARPHIPTLPCSLPISLSAMEPGTGASSV